MGDNRVNQTIRKIIAHIDQTIAYCHGQTFASFMENRMLQEACAFHVLQIGELSKNVLHDDFTAAHPEIPWRQMYGMRNRIVHDYEGVQMKIVWDTITADFPMLKRSLLTLLLEMEH